MNDFIAICSHEGIKEQNNEFHYDHGVRGLKTYSLHCVDMIVQKLIENEDYLKIAKAQWQRSHGPKRSKTKRK